MLSGGAAPILAFLATAGERPAEVAAGVPAAGAAGGAAALPRPYIQVLVAWTAPGLSWIPVRVAWWPAESVSRTVNGPAPRPAGASQYP